MDPSQPELWYDYTPDQHIYCILVREPAKLYLESWPTEMKILMFFSVKPLSFDVICYVAINN